MYYSVQKLVMQRWAAEIILFGWRTAKKDCKHVLIKIFLYCVFHWNGASTQRHNTSVEYDYKCVYNHKKPVTSAIKHQSDSMQSLLCWSNDEWDGLTDPWKPPYQKRPHTHQFMRWQSRWHVSQVPPHHPASCTQESLPLSREHFKKWSWGFLPEDIQGINNNPPEKVGTILKHYFYFVHCRGLLYGKAVGVELRKR